MQVVDAGQRLDEEKELTAVELSEHLPVQSGELRLVVLVDATVLLVVADDPLDRVERRERLGESRTARSWRQEVVVDAVGERLGLLVRVRAGYRQRRVRMVIKDAERIRAAHLPST